MKNEELHQWSRHYDALLWNVTTIFAAAIGGLLAFCFTTFNAYMTIVGLIVTPIPIYFAASFRESRDLINRQLDVEDRKILFEGRKLKQWPLYVFIFLLFEVVWLILLFTKLSAWWPLWLIIGASTLLCSFRWAHLGKSQRGESREEGVSGPIASLTGVAIESSKMDT